MPLRSQLGLGTQPHYKTSADLQICEDVPSRITQSLPKDDQIAVKKSLIFFQTLLKGIVQQFLK